MTFFTEMRVIGRRGLLPFQKGIIGKITALPLILEMIQDDGYPVKYLLTRRLNQDPLDQKGDYMITQRHSNLNIDCVGVLWVSTFKTLN